MFNFFFVFFFLSIVEGQSIASAPSLQDKENDLSTTEELLQIDARGGQCQCEMAIYGGGCEEKSCTIGCRQHYGHKAFGQCFFYLRPSDTCLCRYPCPC